jgi:hypothetical protein
MKPTFAILALFAALPARAADEVKLEKIKYADLGKRVVANKGKVVVVDFWASY